MMVQADAADETAGAATVVVFDCFGTIVTERRLMPGPEEFVESVTHTLALDPRLAAEIVETVLGALYAAFTDESAFQPATLGLLEAALRERGVVRSKENLDLALWHALGCADDDRYELCEPAARSLRHVAAAGHTVRLLSNCYLPGHLMRRLLTDLKVPEVFDRALFTADGGPKKPDARAFDLIGSGHFQRRIMVGDSPENDITPARALGWGVVEVNPERPDFSELDILLNLRGFQNPRSAHRNVQ